MSGARPEGQAPLPRSILARRMKGTAVTVEEIVESILPRLVGANGAGDNISSRCPFPDHEDRSKSFSFNKKSGLWRCHGRCARKGNAYQLARELGCLPNSSPRRRIAPVVDWGLDAAMRKYGVEVTAKATIFKITDHEGNRCRDHARLHRGEPRFQYWGEGRTYHAWLPWGLVREWGAGTGIGHIVEGDRDALTLAAHGYAGIGILGIDHFEKARRDIVRPLREMGIDSLVLTPDNDEVGIAAASEWVSKLEGDGFVVGVRTLPESINNVPVKDIFDAYAADRDRFDDLMFDLPVHWRA